MVVSSNGYLESAQAFRRLDPADQPVMREGRKCSIDRIQGKIGQIPAQAPVQRLRRGMVGGPQEFLIDFQALAGYLESGLPAD